MSTDRDNEVHTCHEVARFHPDNVKWPGWDGAIDPFRGPTLMNPRSDFSIEVVPAKAYRELFEAYCRAVGHPNTGGNE